MINKILVRAPNWIGDAVMATPTLSALRRVFKDSEISLLAKPAVAAIFERHPDLDRVILYEDPGIHSRFSGLWRLSRYLRKEKFDLAFLFQNAFEAALLTWIAGIPKRIGFATDGRSLLLTHTLRLERGPFHRTEIYLSLMALVEGEVDHRDQVRKDKRDPFLVVTSSEREDARNFLKSLDVSSSKILIGINPGAAYGTAKRWLPERFAALSDRLVHQFQAEILIFGGASEIEVAKKIQKDMGSHSTLLCGKTTVRQMMALISQCRLFITNDSGPMHVASALRIPLVAVFGPTKPEATFSRGKRDTLIYRKAGCAPCRNRICPTDHRCMEDISVNIVFEAAKQQINLLDTNHGAVFLDRDGTINDDTGYIDSLERFSLLPGAVFAIKRLNQHGIPVFLVTNQSGIARSLLSDQFLCKLHLHLQGLLAREGAFLDDIYYCPHHPDGVSCGCRKPAGGMIERAILDHKIDFSASYVVGDKVSDIMLADALPSEGKAKSVLVQTGEGVAALKKLKGLGGRPDHVSEDLSQAVDWILEQIKGGNGGN